MTESRMVELFGQPICSQPEGGWGDVVKRQNCPFLDRKCIKTRKSQPRISIGTCTVEYGKDRNPIIICPFRFLERHQVFSDCIHLLTLHEPGNEFHVVPEITVPGGSIDYVLVSARKRQVCDFVAIELQTLDTTGTVWPERQRFLASHGLKVRAGDRTSASGFGMNWKMTAKTILVQLHHKIETFEHLGKHLVLVLQDELFEYMRREFSFDHVQRARLGDPMHVHSYRLMKMDASYQLELRDRWSTDANGIAACLGLQASAKIELAAIIELLQSMLSRETLLRLA